MRELLPKDKIFLKIDEKMKTGCKSGTKEFYLGHGCRSTRKTHRQQKTVLSAVWCLSVFLEFLRSGYLSTSKKILDFF